MNKSKRVETLKINYRKEKKNLTGKTIYLDLQRFINEDKMKGASDFSFLFFYFLGILFWNFLFFLATNCLIIVKIK